MHRTSLDILKKSSNKFRKNEKTKIYPFTLKDLFIRIFFLNHINNTHNNTLTHKDHPSKIKTKKSY